MPTSPEALYPTLPHGPDAPRELWSRQADILRAYHPLNVSKSDVALELPTGAGKTLVGSLIADWRRRAYGERAAFLAPTRQLARQAAAQARIYGIPVADLVGTHRKWSPADQASFTQGEAVGFATYSAVFNANPHVSAQTLVLDDAHAAEGFVAGNWSVDISRDSVAFELVLAVLEQVGAISPILARRIRREEQQAAGPAPVYVAGVAEVAAAADDLERALDQAVAQGALPDDAKFPIAMLRGQYAACLVYISRRQILIRPLVAPTSYHEAFTAANQRVYMSATLGDGGELERAFGRRKITRIPVPAGWERQGTGRRFFCFPDLVTGLDAEVSRDTFTGETLTAFGKGVLIAPNNRVLDKALAAIVPAGTPVLRAEQFADAPDDFADAPAGLLALANRYDGIDLPDETCRLVILVGLPAGAHLQERFLHESLSATVVLSERIRTRLTQGAGRATRNSADYAAVLSLGKDLWEFVARKEVQATMHPELRAEIAFGLEYSTGISPDEVAENLAHFRAQDAEWREAEEGIRTDRDGTPRAAGPGTAELTAAVEYEVAAIDAAWQGDWPRAVEQAKKAVEALAGGQQIRRYQALWHYVLASWAVIAGRRDNREHWLTLAQTHFDAARAAAQGTKWLSELTTDAASLVNPAPPDLSPVDLEVVLQIAVHPMRAGRTNQFTKQVQTIRTGLAQTKAAPYEAALVALGELAGAKVLKRTGGDAEPDAVWLFGDELWVAWEAKSDADPDGQLKATRVREAGGHLNFAASRQGVAAPPGSVTLIVTPQTVLHPAAVQVSDVETYLVTPGRVLDLAGRLIEAWETIRTQTAGLQPVNAEQVVAELLRARRALPSQWLSDCTERAVSDG
ncbi:DEAD/DEAH box helicase [Mangrovihabitans endophyticus]|uniref:DEAD/DEAH box helicase n=1 Tax=Mangrovihabitans endophyticus TaxID=1751298 RepID=UPI001663D0A5|nr:DEAD/DEAH box helicase [Mangrovihabitans endophyticus]